MARKFQQPEPGSKFNRWTIVSYAGVRRNFHHSLCKCECGNERTLITRQVISGHSKSCGCLKLEVCAANMLAGRDLTANPHANYKRPEYGIWCAMKDRCNRQANRNFKDYGGRGIKICPEWDHSFDAFFSYVGARPSKHHSIDRIDNDGDYAPGNVRWATQSQQARNTRIAKTVSFNGETLHLLEWAARYGIGYSSLNYRLAHGWEFERAITTPVRVSRA